MGIFLYLISQELHMYPGLRVHTNKSISGLGFWK